MHESPVLRPAPARSRRRDPGPDQRQLSESVASHLRERIISGELRAGEFLRIDVIAKALKVSSTPVREGLLLLCSESFVRLVPRRGFVVNSFGREDLRDLVWTQATLASELAARAADRISRSDLGRLGELLVDHEAALARADEAAAARLDDRFHQMINLAAQSPWFELLLGNLTRQLPSRWSAVLDGLPEGALEYHRLIFSALRLKDPETVRSLMHRHIASEAAAHLAPLLEVRGNGRAVAGLSTFNPWKQ